MRLKILIFYWETFVWNSMQVRIHHQFEYFYRPQRSWGKVMFLHVSVILFTRGGSASVRAGIPPWQGRPPPLARRPPRQGRPPPAQCILGDTVNERAVCILLERNSCLLQIAWHAKYRKKQRYLRPAIVELLGVFVHPTSAYNVWLKLYLPIPKLLIYSWVICHTNMYILPKFLLLFCDIFLV